MAMQREGRPRPNTNAAYERGKEDARACLARGGSRQDLIVMAQGADCGSGDVCRADGITDVMREVFGY